MINSNIEELKTLLLNLEQQSSEMADILSQERSLLNSTDANELFRIAQQKKHIIYNLEQSTKITHKFLLNLNIKNGLYGLSAFINLQPPEIKKGLEKVWSSTKRLIENNKQMNETNGSIIELNRRFTQRSLDVLRGQMGSITETYSSSGVSQKSAYSRNISIA